MHTVKGITVLFMLGQLLLAGFIGAPESQDQATSAFEKLKTLEGTWRGKTTEGKEVSVIYELVSGGTALLERFIDESTPQYSNLITMYHMDRGELALKHYCGAGNQPRMNLVRASDDGSTLQFKFVGATNLADINDKHMYKVTFRFRDDGRFTTEWTLRGKGKDVYTEVVAFERVR